MRKDEDSTVLSLQCIEESNSIRFRWVGKPKQAIVYLIGALCSVMLEVGVNRYDEDEINQNAELIKQLVIETLKRG